MTVNSWSGTVPAAPTKIDSRGVTRGTWRGYVRWFFYFDARFITEFDFFLQNERYTYAIPSGTLIAGTNTIVITVASGSDGDVYL